jgi:hypothetical protein
MLLDVNHKLLLTGQVAHRALFAMECSMSASAIMRQLNRGEGQRRFVVAANPVFGELRSRLDLDSAPGVPWVSKRKSVFRYLFCYDCIVIPQVKLD